MSLRGTRCNRAAPSGNQIAQRRFEVILGIFRVLNIRKPILNSRYSIESFFLIVYSSNSGRRNTCQPSPNCHRQRSTHFLMTRAQISCPASRYVSDTSLNHHRPKDTRANRLLSQIVEAVIAQPNRISIAQWRNDERLSDPHLDFLDRSFAKFRTPEFGIKFSKCVHRYRVAWGAAINCPIAAPHITASD